MKKTILMLFMLFGISLLCMAQRSVDVLYLKDGSVIRGQVVDVVPNEQVKIQLYDGSVYVYSMDLVAKIEKETLNYGREKRNVLRKSTLRGYHGFIDSGFLFGDENMFETTTSHGYQFNDHIFLGGGTGIHYYYDYSDYYDDSLVGIPLFVNFRANFTKRKITPFVDTRLGYTFGDIEGAYGSAGIGVRFSLGGKKALNVMLTVSAQDYDYDYYYYDYYYDDTDSFVNGGFRIGFEF